MENHFQQSATNGNFGETVAPQLIESYFGKLTYVNDIYDFVSESGVYIEIKTCLELIKSGNPKYPLRFGRFTLDLAQDTFLKNRNGYYVFIVKRDDKVIFCKIIPALKITFKPSLQWKTLFLSVKAPVGVNIPPNPETLKTPPNNDFVTETGGNHE